MTLVLTVPNGTPNALALLQQDGDSNTALTALVLETGPLPSCTGVAAFTTAAINAALATGAAEVCFPPGVYEVTGAITQSSSGQVLNFYPGAVLRFAASGAGKLIINGIGARIAGSPVGRFDAASAVAYVAVDLHGERSECDGWRWEVNANVSNCNLMRLSGRFSRAGEITYTGVGSFKNGCEHSNQDGSRVEFTRSGPHQWAMTDDGVTTRNYDALVRLRSIRSVVDGLTIEHGGRQLFGVAVIDHAGSHNTVNDAQINSFASGNAILSRDDCEGLVLNDCFLQGNFFASQTALLMGDGSKTVGVPAVGLLKCNDCRIVNWDLGVRITGSCDAPEFNGCTIANNKTAQVQLDSQRASGAWPTSALSFYGCYSEERSFPGAPFLHLKSGTLDGGVVSGCEIGYTGTAIVADLAFGGNVLELLGCRFPASSPTDAVTTPNTSSLFYFGRNVLNGSNLIGTGAFASKAMSAFDPQLVGLTVGTVGTGTALNRISEISTDTYTLNFGNIAAGATVALTFFYPGLPTGAQLNVTFGTGYAAAIAAGVQMTPYINAPNSFGVAATNTSGAPILAVTGNARITVTTFS